MSSIITTTSANTSRRSSVAYENLAIPSTGRRESSSEIVLRNSNSAQVHNGRCENGDETLIKIPIIGFEVMEERARFTVFKLRVENERLNETWLVFRRYTDFERLQAKLREEHPHLTIALPPKRWIRDNFETVFLEDRMKGLQAFVDSILIQHRLSDCEIVRDFFCLDEPPLYPENAEESRAMYGSLEESIMHLKDVLNAKQTEIQILRAQLALVNTQHENLLKQTKNCRQCGNRSSMLLSPLHNSGNASPIAASTPNFSLTPDRNRSLSFRSNQSRHSLPSTLNQTTSLKYFSNITNTVKGNNNDGSSVKAKAPSLKINGISSTPSSSSSNSDLASTSETESTTSSPKTSKCTGTGLREKSIDNNLTKTNCKPIPEP